jgi:DNA polymerase-3 subunit epsilon
LTGVAELLCLGADAVRPALDRAWDQMRQPTASTNPAGAGPTAPTAPAPTSSFTLKVGDIVVFTGEMSRPREDLERIAADAGLVPHPAVTKKVAVVVAADPDSLSGKARKAADYGIPIITEAAFVKLIDQRK